MNSLKDLCTVLLAISAEAKSPVHILRSQRMKTVGSSQLAILQAVLKQLSGEPLPALDILPGDSCF